jgi:hypothetical protein
MQFGDVGRSTEVFGVLLNSGWLNIEMRHMADGLVLAVYLLAEKCAALEMDATRLHPNARDGKIQPRLEMVRRRESDPRPRMGRCSLL